MDINLLRSLVTVATLAAFAGVVWWAYGAARKERFERDAMLPFEEEGDSDAASFRVREAAPHPFPLSRVERGNELGEMARGHCPDQEKK